MNFRNNLIRIITAVFITTLVGNYISASDIKDSDIVDKAVSNNPALISAEKMKRSAEAQAWKSYWLPNPMVGMEEMRGENDIFSHGTRKFIVTQKLIQPFTFAFRLGASLDKNNVMKSVYDKQYWMTREKAYSAYYDLYLINMIIDITEENVEILKQFSRIAASNYSTGKATQQGVLKAEVEFARLKNKLITLNQKKSIIIAKLNSITGEDNTVSADDKTSKPVVNDMQLSFDDIEAYLPESPEVLKAAADKSMAENMRNMAISSYIPDLNVTYKKYVESDNFDLMFMVELPVWFLTDNQSDVSAGVENASAKANMYQDVMNKTKAEAKEHYEIIKSTERLVTLYETTLIPQAQNAFKSSQGAYQSGQIEFISLLDSERTLLNFKIEYYQNYVEYLKHYRMLETLLGKDLESQKSQDPSPKLKQDEERE